MKQKMVADKSNSKQIEEKIQIDISTVEQKVGDQGKNKIKPEEMTVDWDVSSFSIMKDDQDEEEQDEINPQDGK